MKWINCRETLPAEDGRYLVLQTFFGPCINNSKIVRSNIPFVSNYNKTHGWNLQLDLAEITHWMNIPLLDNSIYEHGKGK